LAEDFELTKLLNLSDEFYTTTVQPLMYSYIREKKYFQGNAAIAPGSTGDPAVMLDLAQAMQDSGELVRGYAAWALGKIGGSQAKQVLEASLGLETWSWLEGRLKPPCLLPEMTVSNRRHERRVSSSARPQ
jgi:epoxyqueuosine reductase